MKRREVGGIAISLMFFSSSDAAGARPLSAASAERTLPTVTLSTTIACTHTHTHTHAHHIYNV